MFETQGRIVPGLQYKIVDEFGEELPHDGEAFGELLIRGPWIAAEYYHDDRTEQSFVDGWLRTGDVCKVTPEGYIKITDRAKDLIKSGGEWISSIDLENEIMAHPDVAEATVGGLHHLKRPERPAAFGVVRAGGTGPADPRPPPGLWMAGPTAGRSTRSGHRRSAPERSRSPPTTSI